MGRSGSWPESDAARYIADIEARATEQADAVIAISYELRRQIDLLYRCPDWKLSVIYHGISPVRFDSLDGEKKFERAPYGIAEDEPLCLFVGSLTFRKGADILLDAAGKVLANVSAAKFILAGKGDMRTRLEADAKRQGIDHAVRFIDNLSSEELARLYRCADVIAQPYRYDPFGITTLSAWAACKPVVLCNEGAAWEFAYDKVNALKAQEEDFAEALGEILGDADHARWLGQNGRAAVESAFSWPVIAEQTVAAYTRKEKQDAPIIIKQTS